jgi:4-amino-4-deoxy-L-arabinose transferase-like glycosyltransferase
MRNKSHLILISLIVIGGALRFYQLDSAPLSLNWDEVSHGYNAYSILTTGRDEWGETLPGIFRAFGDYKLPTYIYLTTIPVAMFGLSAFAVRFVSALAGVLAILGIYLLVKQIFRKHKQMDILAHISALVMALLPWHFFLSRPALEANLALTLFIFGLYFLLRARHLPASLYPGIVLLGLTMHTYNTYRVLTPLILFGFLWLYHRRFSWRQILTGIVIMTIFVVPIALQLVSGSGQARYSQLQILTPQAVYQIGEDRASSSLPPALSRLVHNRPVYLVRTVGLHYLAHFSPIFFMQSRGAQAQFAVPGANMITLVATILFYLGLFVFFYRSRYRPYLFTLLLLALAPIASSLTIDPPQALRPSPMILPLVIMVAYIFVMIYNRSRYVFSLLLFFFVISSALYIRNYYVTYINSYSSAYQYGYEQAIDYLSGKSGRIVWTKRLAEPHIFWAFHTHLAPSILQDEDRSTRFARSDWYWTDRIDEVYFVNDWLIPTTKVTDLPLESGQIINIVGATLVTSPDHVPANLSIEKTITNPLGQPVFIIGTIR